MCGGPKVTDWKKNTSGCRSLEQAISLLEDNGIILPEDVEIVIYDDELPPDVLATYLLPSRCSKDTHYSWASLLLNRYGQVPIKVRPCVFESDEQIIAVVSHELHELASLREYFANNETVSATRILSLISTDTRIKNFHCLAWQHADQAVLEFRDRHHD